MKTHQRVLGVFLLAVIGACATTDATRNRVEGGEAVSSGEAPLALPRMIELGSDSCASCKAMMPVLDELRERHADVLDVEFIDVWKFPEQAEPFGARVIPTQIFLAPDGTELARHKGFFAADDIRAKWAELGFPLE